MNSKAVRLAAVFLLSPIPFVCHAQDFSADVVYITPVKPGAPGKGAESSPHQASRIYVSSEQLRLETRGLTGTVLLADGAEHTAFALFPGEKAYQPLTSGPSGYFRAQSAEDACPDWQKASEQKMVCEKVGPEVVAGRRTVKYQNKGASKAATSAVWVDVALKFVVKWQGAGAGAELRNIKEAQQAADLFAVPSDYEILKPQPGKSKGFAQKTK